MDAEVFFYALACPRMALANTFLCGQRLAKKAFDCGVEDWVLCAIQGKWKGWARAAREVKSAAGTDFSGRVRVARASNAGRPRRTRSAAWFLSAPASGSHRLRLPAGHQPFRIDLRPTGALQGCKAHLLFIFPILGTQQLSGSRSLVYLPRKQKNVWTSSCNDAALCGSVLPCRNAMAPSGGYHYPHTRIVCYGQMGSGHNNQICHKFCDLFSSLLHSNFFQSFCFCWENFAIPLKSNFSMDCEMQYSRAIYK